MILLTIPGCLLLNVLLFVHKLVHALVWWWVMDLMLFQDIVG